MSWGLSPDAIFGAIITLGIVMVGALWKLATMLAEVRSQVRPNGGSTIKDDTRTSAVEARRAREAADAARELAEKVAADLVDDRRHTARDGAEHAAALKRVEHDVSNVKASQELLLDRQIEAEARTHRVADDLKTGLTTLRQEVSEDAQRREEASEVRAGERMAEAYGLLAEVTANRTDGPIVMPLPPGHVAAHAHELPSVEQPSVTGGPIEETE